MSEIIKVGMADLKTCVSPDLSLIHISEPTRH